MQLHRYTDTLHFEVSSTGTQHAREITLIISLAPWPAVVPQGPPLGVPSHQPLCCHWLITCHSRHPHAKVSKRRIGHQPEPMRSSSGPHWALCVTEPMLRATLELGDANLPLGLERASPASLQTSGMRHSFQIRRPSAPFAFIATALPGALRKGPEEGSLHSGNCLLFTVGEEKV